MQNVTVSGAFFRRKAFRMRAPPPVVPLDDPPTRDVGSAAALSSSIYGRSVTLRTARHNGTREEGRRPAFYMTIRVREIINQCCACRGCSQLTASEPHH